MIIKSKDKHGNQIEFAPKARGARYTVNGQRKRSNYNYKRKIWKRCLMWWSENCVYEALNQILKHNKKPEMRFNKLWTILDTELNQSKKL